MDTTHQHQKSTPTPKLHLGYSATKVVKKRSFSQNSERPPLQDKYLTHLENFVTIRNNFDEISGYSYKNNKNKRKVYGTRHIYNILLEVSIRT